jgi:hypothetical protein
VHEVVAKLTGGRATISAEALRLGVVEQTLLKALRITLGDKRYREFRASVTRWGSKRLVKNGARHRLHHGRRTKRTTPSAKPKEEPTAAQPCGHRFKAGTDGDGRALLWCVVCGYMEAVISRPPTKEEGAALTPEEEIRGEDVG